MLAGLKQCQTPWLQTTPCDTPFFPTNLVAQLKQLATAQNTRIAMVASYSNQELSLKNCPIRQLDSYQVQPVFCLIHQSLSASLEHYLIAGKAKIETWALQENVAILEIALSSHNALDFANINSHAELAQMHEQINQLAIDSKQAP
jgi:molybdopterin-guanine dinucleotide biosynthesis protein A